MDTTPNESRSSDEVQTTQQAQQALAIVSLLPESGAPETTGGIYYAGLGPSPSDNAVTFGSVGIPVDSARASGHFAVVATDSTFSAIEAGLTGVSDGSASWGDYDSDGDLDQAVTGSGTAKIYRNGNPIPVELSEFDAIPDGDDSVSLTWTTASETGNAGFRIQRKVEDESRGHESTWTTVGFVESKDSGGTTTEPQSYQYTAGDLSVGTHQFRLKQIDLDGSSQVHGPISVDVQMRESLKLTAPAPNPVSSTATLSFAVKEQAEATVAVYDMLGRQVSTLFEGRPTPGESTRVRLDTGSLPSGSYIIRLRADGQTRSQRITVVR